MRFQGAAPPDPLIIVCVEILERFRRIEEALDYLCWRVGDVSVREEIAAILKGTSNDD